MICPFLIAPVLESPLLSDFTWLPCFVHHCKFRCVSQAFIFSWIYSVLLILFDFCNTTLNSTLKTTTITSQTKKLWKFPCSFLISQCGRIVMMGAWWKFICILKILKIYLHSHLCVRLLGKQTNKQKRCDDLNLTPNPDDADSNFHHYWTLCLHFFFCPLLKAEG